MKKIVFYFTLFIFITAFFIACFRQATQKDISEIDFKKMPFKTLSEYGIFKGEISELQSTESLLNYEPISPLFTDYAFKKRFVYIPKGKSATFDENNPDKAFVFPENTILVKNFYYPEDFSKADDKKKIIETRLLVKRNNKWEAFPYVWNEEQSEASYKITGATVPVKWKNNTGEINNINYAVPNKNQCKSCHNQGDTFTPIGLKMKQLNNEIQYETGKENQIEHWIKLGKLKGNFKQKENENLVSMNDETASLDLKARSYLDSNCGHCHNQNGPASTSGLNLTIEEKEPFHWGIFKSPVAAGIGAGDFKYDILPGKGKESIITFRMNSIHPGIMMPEIGRVSIHKEGVELIEKWIDELK